MAELTTPDLKALASTKMWRALEAVDIVEDEVSEVGSAKLIAVGIGKRWQSLESGHARWKMPLTVLPSRRVVNAAHHRLSK